MWICLGIDIEFSVCSPLKYFNLWIRLSDNHTCVDDSKIKDQYQREVTCVQRWRWRWFWELYACIYWFIDMCMYCFNNSPSYYFLVHWTIFPFECFCPWIIFVTNVPNVYSLTPSFLILQSPPTLKHYISTLKPTITTLPTTTNSTTFTTYPNNPLKYLYFPHMTQTYIISCSLFHHDC